MSWRIILILIIVGLVITFVAFNVSNSSDISLGFHAFENVPVFVTIFLSFVCGMLCIYPFFLVQKIRAGSMKKKLDVLECEQPPEKTETPPRKVPESISHG